MFVLYLTESLVHLPLLNVLLGVPLELLGLTSAVALGYKYTQEGGEPLDDLAALTVRAQDNRGGLRGDATRRVAGGRSHECGRGSATQLIPWYRLSAKDPKFGISCRGAGGAPRLSAAQMLREEAVVWVTCRAS